MKEKFAEKRDSIRAEMQAHDFALVPVKISVEECEDVLAEIERHLIELNKLKNYLSVKLKKIIEEEKMLEALKRKFGNAIEIEQADQGFEIRYLDEEAKQAFEELKKSREKTINIKNLLRKMEESATPEQQ
jgi:Ca2+-binding EF-hand superfamily protein